MSEHVKPPHKAYTVEERCYIQIIQANFEIFQLMGAFFGNGSSVILASQVPCKSALKLMRGSIH